MTPAAETRGTLYESGLIEPASDGLLRPGGLALTERALAGCALPRGARLLDLGCGTGISIAHLERTFGLEVLGLDVSPLLLGRGRVAGFGPLLRADGAALPLSAGCVDAVLMECVLSVTEDPARVLSECFRVLAPGGSLAMTDLYVRSSSGKSAGCSSGPWTREELITLLGTQGFTVRVWEDHSRALAELAARLVMVHGSLGPLWEYACGAHCKPRDGARPGYFLLVATTSKGSPRTSTEGAPS